MKLIIDFPEEKYEWIKKNNPNADINSIVGAVANGTPYEEKTQDERIFDEKLSEIDACRNTAINKGLPLFFIYHEETGALEIYITETKELFEKVHCCQHLSQYEIESIATDYISYYLGWNGGA